MKRLISLLAILCLLAFAVIPVAAEDNELNYDGASFITDVSYSNPSNFTVIVPRTIDANQVIEFSASQMNILDDEVVYISTESNSVTLTQVNGVRTANMIFSGAGSENQVAEFYKDDTVSRFSVSPMITNANEIPAGAYSGTCKFIVSLDQR